MWTLDDRVFRLLYSPGPGVLASLAAFFSLIGGGWNYTGLAVFLVPRRTRPFALWLGGALALTGILVFGIKAVVARGRPFTVYPPLRQALLDSPTDYSFPSGHAAGSFCAALFLVHVLLARRPRTTRAMAASGALVAVATCIGASRVVLGFHFPSDVVAGALLGGVIGHVAAVRLVRRAAA